MNLFRMVTVLAVVSATAHAQPGLPPAAVAPELPPTVVVTPGDIMARLGEPFTNDRAFQDVPLESALELISLRSGMPILFDPLLGHHQSGVLYPQEPVSLPVLKSVRLGAAMRMMLEPAGLTFLVTPDHVLITTPDLASDRTGLSRSEIARASGGDSPAPQLALAQVEVKNRPLSEVLETISGQTGANVVLSPSVHDQGRTPITITLRNAPVGDAVAVLADMAGLGLIRQGNVLYVTDPEKAEQWEAKQTAVAEMRSAGRREEAMVAYLRDLELRVQVMETERRQREEQIRSLLQRLESVPKPAETEEQPPEVSEAPEAP